MKLVFAIIAFALSLSVHAQTFPVQNLQVNGSATFTGPATIPYAAITGGTITGLSPPIPIASGGTNATTASAALANLGALPLAGGTMTGALTAPTATVNSSSGGAYFGLTDSSGSSSVNFVLRSGSGAIWNIESLSGSGNPLNFDRWVAGAYVDTPLYISNATGMVTMQDGAAVNRSISNTGPDNTGGVGGGIGIRTTSLNGTASLNFDFNSIWNTGTGQGINITAVNGITSNSGTGYWAHTGSFSATGTITASGGLQLPITTVSALPACSTSNRGMLYAVSDFNGAVTYNGTLAGGGSTALPVFCNGTAWTAH